MKWAAIANLSASVNEFTKDLYFEKQKKDAAVIATNEWADFIQNATTHMNQAIQMSEVAKDPTTGNLTVVMKVPQDHPDAFYNNKSLSSYSLNYFDKMGEKLATNVKNPIASAILKERFQAHKVHMAQSLAQQEAVLIHDRRKTMVTDSIEKMARLSYQNPASVESHLSDALGCINQIADSPTERDKLARIAQERIMEGAALGTVHQNPQGYLSNPIWGQHLSPEAQVRFSHMATTIIRQNQAHLQHQVSSMSHPHFESLLHTGKGLPGFEERVASAYGSNSPQFQAFAAKNDLYQKASLAMQTINKGSFAEGSALIQQIAPQSGDIHFDSKHKMASLLQGELKHQFKEANADPAQLVEKIFAQEIPENLPFLTRLQMRKTLQAQKGIPESSQKYLMKEEKQRYLDSLESDDPRVVETTVKSLMSLEDNEFAVGKDVLAELLEKKDDVSMLVGLYAEQVLKSGDLAPTLLKMIPVQKQLFSSITPLETKELKENIHGNSSVSRWRDSLVQGQPHNLPAVEQRTQGVLSLARFYQLDRGEDTKQAVNHAVKDLIEDAFIYPVKECAVPKTIISHGRTIPLEKTFLKTNILNLRKALIEGTMPFDRLTTFGGVGDHPILQEVAKEEEQDRLREGKFRLSRNERELYYTIPMKDGSEKILMKSPNEVLFFSLEDLNQEPEISQPQEVSFPIESYMFY